eukprot:gene938-1264_t
MTDVVTAEITWDPQVAAFLTATLGSETFQKDVMQELRELLPAVDVAAHPSLPVALILKGSGPNQVQTGTAAAGMKEVMLSRKAGEAVLRGAQVFVPGVLACSAGLAVGDEVKVTVAMDAPGRPPTFPPESFEFILLDAPCTALGLRPRLVQQQTLSTLLETALYQRQLLATAVKLLKPGGFLVFSTCTFNPEEAAMVQRFDPGGPDDTIGFFVAKFKKVCSWAT